MLPRGHMSRERLSDMLLAFVGMAADILDFITEAIEDTKVNCSGDRTLLAIVLIVFSLSLLQFALGLNLFIYKKNSNEVGEEVWSILVTMFLQDIPFLTIRLYLLTTSDDWLETLHDAVNRQFFAVKNVLVLMIQMYRLCILWRFNRNRTPLVERYVQTDV